MGRYGPLFVCDLILPKVHSLLGSFEKQSVLSAGEPARGLTLLYISHFNSQLSILLFIWSHFNTLGLF